MMKLQMQVKELSLEEVLNHSKKEYNSYEWVKTVKSYLKYGDVKFYERVNGPHSYDEIFVVYTLQEGLRLFGGVNYSSCLSSGGFCKVYINDNRVFSSLFEEVAKEPFRAAKTNKNRKALVKLSNDVGGLIYSDLF